MGKVTVNICAEQVDQIVLDVLYTTRSSLLKDYEKGTTGVYSFDPVKERKKIGKTIEAIERVIKWYSVPGSVEFDKLKDYD